MSADLIERLRALAKPAKVFAGIDARGPVYRNDKPANAKLLKEAADALATAEAENAELTKALLRIAEGNLGDAHWQANYEKIRAVAAEALASRLHKEGDTNG